MPSANRVVTWVFAGLMVPVVVVVAVGVWWFAAGPGRTPASAATTTPEPTPFSPGGSLDDTGLKSVSDGVDDSSPATPLAPILFAEDVDPYGNERPEFVTGLLRRELYRQALLLTAREDFKLTTRDAALGEPPPDGLAAGARVRVQVRLPNWVMPRDVRIDAGPVESSRAVWKAESKVPTQEKVLDAVRTADAFSRGEYQTALRRVGGWKAEAVKRTDAGVPAAAETALARPTVVSQLAAVRALHAALRESGESPALLSAVSRGYAHLGALTDRLWDGSTWVFKARSLLYAERLRRNDPTAPDGLWARGYALALAGRHADALADFAEADKLAGSRKPPDWVPLAVAVCKFDSAHLATASADGPLADLALFFRFQTDFEWEYPAVGIQVGLELLKRVPECHRAADCMARSGRLDMRRHSEAALAALRTGYVEELDRVSDLPRDVFRVVQNHGTLDDLLPELVACGRDANDRRELSWTVLGKVAVESRLTLLEARLSFLRFGLSVPTDEYAAEVRAVVADHPLAAVLDVYSFDPIRQPQKAREVLRPPPVGWYSTRQEGRLRNTQFLTDQDRRAMHNIAYGHGDDLHTDLMLLVKPILDPKEAVLYVQRLLTASPYCPTARAFSILNDWEVIRPNAARWEEENQHAVVSVALAARAVRDKRPADAERLLEKALTQAKEYKVYNQLAELYLARGDEERWLLTLSESLELPAPGLEHAQARVRIANHYLLKKEYALARKYAEPAAQTWAEWALLCAAQAAEGDGDLDAAETWLRRSAERYEDDVRVWYFWCLRTGRGDVDAARRLVAAHVKRVGTPRVDSDRVTAGVLLVAEGKPADAAPMFEACFAGKDGYFLTVAAVLWDQAGDTANRDRALSAVPADDRVAPLVRLLRETLKAGETATPTPKQVDEAMKLLPEHLRNNAGYLIGQFLLQRGEKELAKGYLERSTKGMAPGAMTPALAGLALQRK